MLDVDEKANQALNELFEHYRTPCYEAMKHWLCALYELKKERMVLCLNEKECFMHCMQTKFLHDLLIMIELNDE